MSLQRSSLQIIKVITTQVWNSSMWATGIKRVKWCQWGHQPIGSALGLLVCYHMLVLRTRTSGWLHVWALAGASRRRTWRVNVIPHDRETFIWLHLSLDFHETWRTGGPECSTCSTNWYGSCGDCWKALHDTFFFWLFYRNSLTKNMLKCFSRLNHVRESDLYLTFLACKRASLSKKKTKQTTTISWFTLNDTESSKLNTWVIFPGLVEKN